MLLLLLLLLVVVVDDMILIIILGLLVLRSSISSVLQSATDKTKNKRIRPPIAPVQRFFKRVIALICPLPETKLQSVHVLT